MAGVAQSNLLKCCFTSTETVGLLGTGAQDFRSFCLMSSDAKSILGKIYAQDGERERERETLLLNVHGGE